MESHREHQADDLNPHPHEEHALEEVVDIEEYAKAGRKPPRAKKYRIRIDKQKFEVDKPSITGRELLALVAKAPDRYMISQKLHGGQVKRIPPDQKVDLTEPGVERFMTLPLDQTEG
jgi:hypothetical protein